MNKTFEVARYEYTHHVARPRFWIALLSLPIGIVLVIFISVVISFTSMSKLPVGYVDEANLISQAFAGPQKPSLFEPVIPMLPFSSAEEARAAAEHGDIQAYFIISKAYESTFQVKYYFNEPLTSTIRRQIQQFLTKNLLVGINVPNRARADAGSQYTLVSLDGTRSTAENEIAKIVVPLVVGLLFVIVVLSSGGYLLQAVVEEKENRTIEIMVTSTSPNELMAGKIIGNLSVGLTQILVWALLAAALVLALGDRVPFLRDMHISWTNMGLSLLLLLPSFVFTAALMAMLGATVTDSQGSRPGYRSYHLSNYDPVLFLFSADDASKRRLLAGVKLLSTERARRDVCADGVHSGARLGTGAGHRDADALFCAYSVAGR